jgi:two-component system LytT family sensor kinase
VSGTLLGLITMGVYVRAFLKSSGIHKYSYVVMMIASLFPWFAVYLGATNYNFLGIDYVPVVSVLSGVLYIVGVIWFSLFNVIPIATEMVFRQSKEGVIVIDLEEHIVDVNDAFISIYPELKDLKPRYILNTFIQKHLELSPIKQGETCFQFQLNKDGQKQHYSVEITHIVIDQTTVVGKIITLNDITAYIEHQKALESIASTAMFQAETNEVSFLQAQIKPHFINNILGMIGSMISRDPQGARDLIGNLGEYLANCYYFDSTTPFVLLEQELETINTYVSIEKARFAERLQYHVQCEKMPDIRIPRLILQPLVENAIRHGILKKAEGGNVWLTIVLEESKVCFEISDDGVGMTQEKITEIFNHTSKDQGIGILNIHTRLLKYYGEGLSIRSIEKKGTSVTFSIPLSNCKKEA